MLDFVTPHYHGLAKYMQKNNKKALIDYGRVIKTETIGLDTYTTYEIPLIYRHKKLVFKVKLQVKVPGIVAY